MADSIRGLTVEISADASSFNKAMNSMRKSAQMSKSELDALQKSLELEFDADKFARAQQVAQNAIDQTAANADALRQRLKFLEESGNVDTDAYRKLQAELAKTELQGQQLQKQLERLNAIKFTQLGNEVQKVGGKIENAGKALTPFSVAAAGAIAAGAALGKSAVSTADEVATLATQYDTTAEAIQKFNYVALQTDTDAETLYKGLVKIRAGVADIASGTTSAASSALQSLRLDFASFDGTEDQFYAIINALASMEDKTQMVAVANDIFGDKLANNLLPLIYGGTDAINEYCAEYDELGAMTNEQVAALAEFDNVLNKIKTQLQNVAGQIGAALLPLMQSLAAVVSESIVPKLQRLAEWFNGLTLGQQKFALAALAVVAALAPLTIGIGKLVGAVGNIIKFIPQLQAGLTALAAHPIILIIAAVAAVVMLLYTQCEAFREAIGNLVGMLGQALQPILSLITGLLSQIMGLLSPILDTVGQILAIVINTVVTALQPLFDILSFIFQLLQPLLQIALIPLQLCLQALQVPLQIIGQLLGWLAPLFAVFGNVVKGVFSGVVKVINFVLGFIEDAVNFVIGIINGLIDGVNAALGWLGVNIGRISEVKLRIDTTEIDDIDDVNAVIDSTPPAPDTSGTGGGRGGGTVYDNGGVAGGGDTYYNDNSNHTTTQNVTVTIQNYAAEVDVDAMVREINQKLAEAM